MGYYHYHLESVIRISSANVAVLEQSLGKSLKDLIDEQDYSLYLDMDVDGNVKDISFDESKRWEDSFYDEIAPFVQDGSYVQVRNDDGYVFRLMYKGGKMYRVSPTWHIPE